MVDDGSIEQLWPTPDRRQRWRQLLDWLDPRPGERVLDVGFGGGEALRAMARRLGPTGLAVGVEPVVRRVAALQDTRDPDVAPVVGMVGTAQALAIGADTFDAVLCVNVLEAVPDRQLALAEIRRVLRPGGRALVAHDDYESQVYAGADRGLTRRCVYAYANAQIDWPSYAASDGQMGRHLPALFRAAGFRDPEIRVLPLVNTEYREPLSGWVHAQFSARFVAAVSDLTQEEIDRWHAELAAAGERGEYLYCRNLYVCWGRK